MKRMVGTPSPRQPARPRSMTSRTSLRVDKTAERPTKGLPVLVCTSLAKVVLPLPGGPHSRVLVRVSAASSRPTGVSGPMTGASPSRSSHRLGLALSARGEASPGAWKREGMAQHPPGPEPQGLTRASVPPRRPPRVLPPRPSWRALGALVALGALGPVGPMGFLAVRPFLGSSAFGSSAAAFLALPFTGFSSVFGSRPTSSSSASWAPSPLRHPSLRIAGVAAGAGRVQGAEGGEELLEDVRVVDVPRGDAPGV